MYWGLALKMRREGRGGEGKKSREEEVNPVIRDGAGWWDIMIKCYLDRMRISLKQSLFHLGKLHQRGVGRESIQEQQHLTLLEGGKEIFDISPFQRDLFTTQLVLFFIIEKLHPIASCDNNMTVAGCINIASEILSLELWFDENVWKDAHIPGSQTCETDIVHLIACKASLRWSLLSQVPWGVFRAVSRKGVGSGGIHFLVSSGYLVQCKWSFPQSCSSLLS